MRTAFVDALIEAAEADPDIWLINADLGFSVLERFADRFPDRYLNVGVAEQNMIGVAAGLALSGFKVFVYSIANFPTQRCLEQLRVDVCYHDAAVVVAAVGGGFAYGPQGYTHHAIEDLAVMRALPRMRVAAPADRHETRAFVREFVRHPGPAYLRLGKGGEPDLHPQKLDSAPIRPILMRPGSDVVLLASGAILGEALAAAGQLEQKGVSARVVSLPMLKPLAEADLLRLVSDTKLIATIEEHSLIGGLRDAVAPLLAGQRNAARLVGFGVGDGATSGMSGSQAAMRVHCGLDSASLCAGVMAALAD
jgi:transketolase